MTLGTVVGHGCCTALAVIGGRYVSTKISVKHGTFGILLTPHVLTIIPNSYLWRFAPLPIIRSFLPIRSHRYISWRRNGNPYKPRDTVIIYHSIRHNINRTKAVFQNNLDAPFIPMWSENGCDARFNSGANIRASRKATVSIKNTTSTTPSFDLFLFLSPFYVQKFWASFSLLK